MCSCISILSYKFPYLCNFFLILLKVIYFESKSSLSDFNINFEP